MFRIGQEEIDAVTRVINSKSLFKVNNALKETEACEKDMREKFDVKNAILMTSGKAAMISALIGMGVGPGDQVIVPAYTYMASAVAVIAVGAIPVLAEVDDSLTIDPEDVKKKITKHTKAIIPVHIQGFPCNMDALCAIAKEHNLVILEDSCQSDGGSFHGKRLGTIGTAGAMSFNQFKIISAGEGGALLTNDDAVFQRALIYHDSSAVAYFGNQMDGFNEEVFCGTEYRTDEVKAAIMRVQLTRLDGILADLRRVKKTLMDELKNDFKFIRSNDIEGDCGTTLTFAFDTIAEADAFAQKVGGECPINTGKHVYRHWTPVMNKKGAFHPLMDPFKMEANKDIIPDYSPDMCPVTLDYLAKSTHTYLRPDMTDEQIEAFIKKCRA
ncbi:MAG: DegT/DnrJ/EryC1/StrS family aminotransferase [Clostridia bacterium]|nr:DegT/DnrJ/EryC1/StrS family aminotransferase [Clostridia bacterium]